LVSCRSAACDYKQSEYGRVILPLTVIRRLDCVLEPTKAAVLEKHGQLASRIENLEPVLEAVSGGQFYNTSPLTFTKLLDDPSTIADSLSLYVGGFSAAAMDVIDKFDFGIQIERLRRANLLPGSERTIVACTRSTGPRSPAGETTSASRHHAWLRSAAVRPVG
jgi:type I restriction-modification system DNA methylase subunit